MSHRVRRSLLAFLAIAAIAAPGLRMRGATQGTPASRAPFAKRVVTTGLANPFQMVWGPDDYLWVTERTAGRVTRVLPSDGSKTPAIAIGDFLAGGPGGLLGMALDPGLLKGTGNDYVYVAYTYDADAGSGDGQPPDEDRALHLRSARARARQRRGTSWPACPPARIIRAGASSSVPIGSCISRSATWAPTSWPTSAIPIARRAVPTVAQLQARDWSLYEGKVLRLNLDGSIPADNPTIAGVKSHVYSYGHRNPQGLVFAPDGKLYESEHGPNTDDEVNLIRAGGNYGWPHVAGYRDDQSYAYANWSASKGVPCASLTFTAYPAVPPSVPLQKESAWSHPDFTPPIQTFRTVPTGYDFKNPKCAERELYYQCWPTVAPSSLAVYAAKNGIPGWDHSLLMPSLKHGTVYRIQLNAAGTAVVGEPDENEHLQDGESYRDVTMRPDGLALFIATDVGGNTQDQSGRPAARVENPGAILEFRYITDRSR